VTSRLVPACLSVVLLSESPSCFRSALRCTFSARFSCRARSFCRFVKVYERFLPYRCLIYQPLRFRLYGYGFTAFLVSTSTQRVSRAMSEHLRWSTMMRLVHRLFTAQNESGSTNVNMALRAAGNLWLRCVPGTKQSIEQKVWRD